MDVPKLTLRRTLTIAAAFAMATALAEIATLLFKKYAFGRWINASVQIGWMAPLADTIVFVIVALLLWAVHRLAPRLLPAHGIIGAFSFLLLVSLALIFPSLHWTALVLFPAGLAAVAARTFRRFSEPALRVAPRVTAVLAAGIVTTAVVMNAGGTWRERRELAGLPNAEGAPNVILLILDTVRAQSLSLFGHDRPTTPELERIAADGITFDLAFSTSPWTLPSHASMFTGRYPYQLSADWEAPLDAQYETIAQTLARGGWATGGFTANIAYTVRETGLHRGFHHYEDLPVSFGQVLLSSSLTRLVTRNKHVRNALNYYENLNRKPADEINADFLGWIDDLPGEQPFFAFLNYCDAHEPYLPPAPYRSMFGTDTIRDLEKIKFGGPFQSGVREHKSRMTPVEARAELDAYEASIAFMDRQIALLFDELQRRGELDNTIVVIAADHGEHFGEHRQWEHGRTLYTQLLHVPLVIRPHASAADIDGMKGVRIARPVSLVDVPATILDLAGVRGHAVGGVSLADLWRDEMQAQPSAVLGMVSPGVRAPPPVGMSSLVSGELHYIEWRNGRRQLFDLANDPLNTTDLAEQDVFRPVADSMRQVLLRLRQPQMATAATRTP